jgi:hypothetical protein
MTEPDNEVPHVEAHAGVAEVSSAPEPEPEPEENGDGMD